MTDTARPRFRTALLVSIAINVLLAAALGAGAWRQAHRVHDGGGAMRLPRPAVIERVLPEADRPALREVLERHRGEMRPRIMAAREARRAVRAAIETDPFDAAKLEAALATMRERDAAVTQFAQQVLTEITAEVSPDGRRAIAKVLWDRRERGRRRERMRERDGR